jgi:Tol biopolymer transport system component
VLGLGVSAVCMALLNGSVVARSATNSSIAFAANHVPDWNGEIYRVTSDGRRLNLSASPAPDLASAVSPDGRWVAFLSGRGGQWAVYVVGSDGRGLHRVSAPLFPLVPNAALEAQIAWSANSHELAALVSGPKALLCLGDRSGLHVHVLKVPGGEAGEPAVAFSPDGSLVAYTAEDATVDVANAAGKRLWSVSGYLTPNAWSSQSLLAVAANSTTISLYNSQGHAVTSFAGSTPVWSPDAKLLASVSQTALAVRSGGVG